MKERSGRREGEKRKGRGKEVQREGLPKLRAASSPTPPHPTCLLFLLPVWMAGSPSSSIQDDSERHSDINTRGASTEFKIVSTENSEQNFQFIRDVMSNFF